MAVPIPAKNSFIDICNIHFDPFLGNDSAALANR